MEQEMYVDETIRMATEYYASGRVAVASGMLTMCGNLFHHAFELIMKAALMRKIDVNAADPLYKHDLPRLWNDLKKHYSVNDIRFNTIAEVIHKFENLRYPDRYLNDYMQISVVGMEKSEIVARFGANPGMHIVLNVDQLEEWWFFVHNVSGFNWKCYLDAIRPPARDFYLGSFGSQVGQVTA